MDRKQLLKIACSLAGINLVDFAKLFGVSHVAVHRTLDGHASKRLNKMIDNFIAEQLSAFHKILQADSAHQTANNQCAQHCEQAHQPASASPAHHVPETQSTATHAQAAQTFALRMRAQRIEKMLGSRETARLNADPVALQKAAESWTPQQLRDHIDATIRRYRFHLSSVEAHLSCLRQNVQAMSDELLGSIPNKNENL